MKGPAASRPRHAGNSAQGNHTHMLVHWKDICRVGLEIPATEPALDRRDICNTIAIKLCAAAALVAGRRETF